MADLVLGPLLRYVGTTDATIWVETDAACEVEVLGRREQTFCVAGPSLRAGAVEDLEPGRAGVRGGARRRAALAAAGSEFPPSVLRTFRADEQIELVFGSCRVALPQEPPYTLPKEATRRTAAASTPCTRSRSRSSTTTRPPTRTSCSSAATRSTPTRSRRRRRSSSTAARAGPPARRRPGRRLRGVHAPLPRVVVGPGDPLAALDGLELDGHRRPRHARRLEHLRGLVRGDGGGAWWRDRVIGGMVSYWIYQFIGNLSPAELRERPLYGGCRRTATTPGPCCASSWRRTTGARGQALELLPRPRHDAADRRRRAHRPLPRSGRAQDHRRRRVGLGRRARERGGVRPPADRHLGPYLLRPPSTTSRPGTRGCDGAWGEGAASWAEKMRQELDFDHWAAFEDSFLRLTRLIERGRLRATRPRRRRRSASSPATSTTPTWPRSLSARRRHRERRLPGRVLAVPQRARQPRASRDRARPLAAGRGDRPKLAGRWGVADPGIRWRFAEGPYFDNQVATLELDGRASELKLDKVPRDPEGRDERLERVFEHRLS